VEPEPEQEKVTVPRKVTPEPGLPKTKTVPSEPEAVPQTKKAPELKESEVKPEPAKRKPAAPKETGNGVQLGDIELFDVLLWSPTCLCTELFLVFVSTHLVTHCLWVF